MKKLKIPVIKTPSFHSKRLSMDEYLKFVLLHLKYTFNRKTYKMWKKQQAVNAPFSLK
jgi:hypothetical protein